MIKTIEELQNEVKKVWLKKDAGQNFSAKNAIMGRKKRKELLKR